MLNIFKDESEKVVLQELIAATQHGETVDQFVAGLAKEDAELVYDLVRRMIKINKAIKNGKRR